MKTCTAIALAVLLVCALAGSVSAASATKVWEQQVSGSYSNNARPAVDPSGNIYVCNRQTSGYCIYVYDWNGNKAASQIGPTIEKTYGGRLTLDKTVHLQCDPQTGYLYAYHNDVIYVIDPTLPDPDAGQTGQIIRQFTDGLTFGWHMQFAISHDGNKIYTVAPPETHATWNRWIVREIPRTELSPTVQATLSTGTSGTDQINWTARAGGEAGNDITVELVAAGQYALATTGTAGVDKITWTAKAAGSAGDDITVALVATGTNTPLSIAVTGHAITVNLATDSSGAATSTAAQVVAAVNADATAKTIVVAASSDTGVAAPVAETALTRFANTPLAVGVAAKAITVYLALDGTGTPISTAADVVAKVNGTYAAYSLVSAASTDTGVAAAFPATHLAGGLTLPVRDPDGDPTNDGFDFTQGYKDYGHWARSFDGTTLIDYGNGNSQVGPDGLYHDYASGPLWRGATSIEWRGVVADSQGHLYVGPNGYKGNEPTKRFIIGHPEYGPDQQFYTPYDRCQGMCVDTADRLWTVDLPYDVTTDLNRFVRCYSDANEVFRFDPTSTGAMAMPIYVAYDRAHERLIVYGVAPASSANQTWLSSWSVSVDEPAKISGVMTDASTGAALANKWVRMDPFNRWNSAWGTTNPIYRPVAVKTDATGSYTIGGVPGTHWAVMANLWDYRTDYTIWPIVPDADYLLTQRSHWNPIAGVTTSGDLPLLRRDSADHVTCDLSTEPTFEQGLFLRDCPQQSTATPPVTWYGNTEFANVGGRGCRAIGLAASDAWMNFDVDTGFIPWDPADPYTGKPMVIEADIYDGGYDRYNLQLDTIFSSVTSLGYPIKNNTGAWQTLTWYRSDAKCNNTIKIEGPNTYIVDFRFGAMYADSQAPTGPDYISKVVVRNAAVPTMYREFGSIKDAKSYALGQTYGTDNGSAFAGGLPVKLTAKAVTMSWLDPLAGATFYIEEADQSSGIRVTAATQPMPGDVVTITGTLTSVTETQELVIQADDVTVIEGQHLDIAPLALSNRSVGGGALSVSRTVGGTTYTMITQPGTRDGSGACNVGLLVRVFGKVTASGAGYIIVDDGTARAGVDPVSGVKIVSDQLWGSPAVGQYVSAVGVVSLGLYDPTPTDKSNNDHWRYPVVLMQDPATCITIY